MENLFELNMNRPITCCFTGHRPQKMPSLFHNNGLLNKHMADMLENEIESAISIGYKFFVSGGGLGFDMSAAKTVLTLRDKYPFIRLNLALPCKNHYERWHPQHKKQFFEIIESTDNVTYVSDKPYSDGCMMKRNKYMVDCSSRIICLYNGSSGGTKNTVLYAKKSYVTIITLDI